MDVVCGSINEWIGFSMEQKIPVYLCNAWDAYAEAKPPWTSEVDQNIDPAKMDPDERKRRWEHWK